jgi:hypothetical protein
MPMTHNEPGKPMNEPHDNDMGRQATVLAHSADAVLSWLQLAEFP